MLKNFPLFVRLKVEEKQCFSPGMNKIFSETGILRAEIFSGVGSNFDMHIF